MITPPALRAVSHADVRESTPAPDMRTWWGRNAKAIGTIIGTATLTIVAGAGGLAGLPHLVGLATSKDTAAIQLELGAVTKAQQTAAELAAKDKIELNKKLDAIAKDAKAARAEALKRTKKPAKQPEE